MALIKLGNLLVLSNVPKFVELSQLIMMFDYGTPFVKNFLLILDGQVPFRRQ